MGVVEDGSGGLWTGAIVRGVMYGLAGSVIKSECDISV